MTTYLSKPARSIRKLIEIGASASVLVRRGMVDLRHPAGAVRAAISASQRGPFAGVIAAGAHYTPHATALIDDRGAVTFAKLDAQSNALTRALHELSIGEGNVMAVLCRDHRELFITAIAANKSGARLILLNTGFAAPQLADVVAREKVELIIADQEFLHRLDTIPASITRILALTDTDTDTAAHPTLAQLIGHESTKPLNPPHTTGGVVLLTSGTTGTPKGAPRDRINPMVAAQLLDRLPAPRKNTVVLAAPLFHGTGLALASLGLAMGNAIAVQRKFDPHATLETLAKTRAHMLVVVPTMLQRIIDLGPEALDDYDLSNLKVIFAAGSSLSTDLCERTANTFGDVLYNLYGSTEVAVATIATPAELRTAPGTVGRPPVGCSVGLYDERGNEITAPYEIGEIYVSSGLSFAAYTDGRTKHSIDGRLSTGDRGYFDNRGLWFVAGRADDMIVSGGENVYPLEVEDLLLRRRDVADVAVVGVDDPDFGARLRAFVVPAPGTQSDSDELQKHVRDNLARFKVPRDIIFVDELPRNATGKIQRNRLQDRSPN